MGDAEGRSGGGASGSWMGEEEAVGGALGEDSGGEQERGGGGGGVVAGDEDVLGGGEEGRGLRVGLQYSILWNTVSGEYRHPVLVSLDTVIRYRIGTGSIQYRT